MKINFKKVLTLLSIVVAFLAYDALLLERFEDVRMFNLIAEFGFTCMAAILYLSIDQLKDKSYYKYLNLGFLLAFVSMLVDGLDQLHYHSELYSALGEKLTLLIAFTLIIIGVNDWINDFVKLNRVLASQVITDELTGLYNRRGMLQQFKKFEEIAQRKKISLSFIIADLDDFKKYNDTMGHLSGDGFLNSLGNSLLELMSENQVIGRWGGEEFAICLLGSDINKAAEFAEKIRVCVLQIDMPSKMGAKKMSVSLGVAELKNNESVMETIKRADRSLYLAKSNGKNQVVTRDRLMAIG